MHYKQPVIPLDARVGDGDRSLLSEALEEMEAGKLNVDGVGPDGYEENFMIQELSENVFDPEKHGAVLLQSARDAMTDQSENGGFVCSSFKEKIELTYGQEGLPMSGTASLPTRKTGKACGAGKPRKKPFSGSMKHRSSFIAPSDFKNTEELSCEGCIAGTDH